MPRRPAIPGARSGLPLYLATAFFARLAEEGMAVAVVLLALQRSGSAGQGAFVLTAWMAPHVIAAPLVGALVSRVRRPRLCYLGALGGFAGAIAVLAASVGRAPAPVALAVALVGGGFGPVVSGGLSSLITALLPAGESRDRAYALDAAVYNAASVAGPAVAGLVAAAASPGTAMLLLAAAAATAAALATGLPYGRRQPAAAGHAPRHAARRSGRGPGSRLAHPGTTRPHRGHLSGLRRRGRPDHHYGAARRPPGAPRSGRHPDDRVALGALVGSLAVARWRPPLSDPRLATLALCGTGVALAAAALPVSPTATTALFLLAGLCDGPLLTATLRLRAAHAPPPVRAQVFTLGAGLKITAAACGATLVGAAAALPPPLLLLGIAAAHLAAALLYTVVRPRERRAPATRHAHGPHCRDARTLP
ncbi:MFS transporter [Streptomyces platensis]|uniref:MFS transporter n=1 Tax=Streptomyces platensis TaxID=58346 RepID=UPI003C2DFB1A